MGKRTTGTCIVGLEYDKGVYLGGDSAGVSGLDISIRTDPKVFKNGPFIMGFTSSFRMGQLLMYKFDPPLRSKSQDDYEFMVIDFIDAVKKCFNDNDFGSKSSNEYGSFLVGYRGKLYIIYEDLQVGINECGYTSIGCGESYALGSLFSTPKLSPRKRVEMALNAASEFSAGVAPPFNIIYQKKPKN